MSDYFKNINEINYEGPDSENPLSFKYYDENKQVLGKTMKEHLRFATCYWHTFTCLLYTSPSPRDRTRSRMPSSA